MFPVKPTYLLDKIPGGQATIPRERRLLAGEGRDLGMKTTLKGIVLGRTDLEVVGDGREEAVAIVGMIQTGVVVVTVEAAFHVEEDSCQTDESRLSTSSAILWVG